VFQAGRKHPRLPGNDFWEEVGLATIGDNNGVPTSIDTLEQSG